MKTMTEKARVRNKIDVLSATGGTVPTRLVETCQEHMGCWTREEHKAYLSALQQHGKEWKKLAAKVKTRTVVQTCKHAQKVHSKNAEGNVRVWRQCRRCYGCGNLKHQNRKVKEDSTK